MNRIYVNKKSEITMIGKAFETAGFRCLRIISACDCHQPGSGNRRNGMIVLDGDKLLVEIVRCRGGVIIDNQKGAIKPLFYSVSFFAIYLPYSVLLPLCPPLYRLMYRSLLGL